MPYLKTHSRLVLREEFDEWAVVFDPDTGNTYALNPVGVMIWKHLTGDKGVEDIIRVLATAVEELPPDVADQVQSFMSSLHSLGLADYVERVERDVP